MNTLNAIGNISANAELRYTPGGDAICAFNFALNSGFGDKQVTSWLNCTVWGKRAEALAPLLLKGNRIGITGELTNRKYTAKDGTEKYSLDCRVSEVTLLGSKGDSNASVSQNNAPKAQQSASNDEFENDIPW
jgi:single-strand DNA-binding protein